MIVRSNLDSRRCRRCRGSIIVLGLPASLGRICRIIIKFKVFYSVDYPVGSKGIITGRPLTGVISWIISPGYALTSDWSTLFQ